MQSIRRNGDGAGNGQRVSLGAWLSALLNIMWLATTLQIILLHKSPCVRGQVQWKQGLAITYDREDFSFDRVIALSLDLYNPIAKSFFTNVALGVLVSKNQILTSYNPFRTILTNKTLWNKLIGSVLYQRYIPANNPSTYLYEAYRFRFTCGRQLQFLPDKDIPDHLWHGTDRRNSPLHDLMILRAHANFTISIVDDIHYNHQTFVRYPKLKTLTCGVRLTKIAKTSDHLGAYFKFVTLALTKADMKYRVLMVVQYEPDDHAVVSCDDWFPREWGYFICILNKENYATLGGGAMLMSEKKLFGVGGFVMFRGAQSILAFTDVRPYFDHLYKTCTYADSGEKSPYKFPEPSWQLPN